MSIKGLVDEYNATVLPWLQSQIDENGRPQLVVIDRIGFDLSGTPYTDFHPPHPHQKPLQSFHVQITNANGVSATFRHALKSGELAPATIILNGHEFSELESTIRKATDYCARDLIQASYTTLVFPYLEQRTREEGQPTVPSVTETLIPCGFELDVDKNNTNFVVSLSDGNGTKVTFNHAVQGKQIQPARVDWAGKDLARLAKLAQSACGSVWALTC